MFIPNKKPSESPEGFMHRCMLNLTMIKQYPREDQRKAMCAVLYRKGKESFESK